MREREREKDGEGGREKERKRTVWKREEKVTEGQGAAEDVLNHFISHILSSSFLLVIPLYLTELELRYLLSKSSFVF